jgi:hypothetical protein
MAQSILIFDFGTNEEAAQQARHKVEAWKQGFRLGNKILLKFERVENEPKAAGDADEAKPAHGKKAGAHKKSSSKEEKDDGTSAQVKLLVRLDFSDHEKLSHQRWLDRIPTEEPFKSAKAETLRHNDASFSKAAERFESLD